MFDWLVLKTYFHFNEFPCRFPPLFHRTYSISSSERSHSFQTNLTRGSNNVGVMIQIRCFGWFNNNTMGLKWLKGLTFSFNSEGFTKIYNVNSFSVRSLIVLPLFSGSEVRRRIQAGALSRCYSSCFQRPHVCTLCWARDSEEYSRALPWGAPEVLTQYVYFIIHLYWETLSYQFRSTWLNLSRLKSHFYQRQ